jgi:putative tryptophan/tyrosine transport system substrate-binding protein
MRRRQLLALAALSAGAPTLVLAQLRRSSIGLLWLASPEAVPLRKALFEGLREQGYVEGRNLSVEDRTASDRYEGLLAGAQQLAEAKVGVIVAFGNTSARAAHRTTTSVPIVMIAGMDPVKDGLAVSLARPGGNVTGLSTLSNEMHAKWAQLIRETLPRARRIGAIVTPTSDLGPRYLRDLQATAGGLGLEFAPFEVRSALDLEPAFAAAGKSGVDAVFVVPSTLLRAHRREIGALSLEHRLPWFGYSSEFSASGALLSYGVDRGRLFRRAGVYAGRILKGASPGELPIESPTEFDLVINLRSAKALGIVVPPAVLLRATQTLE